MQPDKVTSNEGLGNIRSFIESKELVLRCWKFIDVYESLLKLTDTPIFWDRLSAVSAQTFRLVWSILNRLRRCLVILSRLYFVNGTFAGYHHGHSGM